jgi:energy-coupling factor transport system ATP-binding protein
MVRIADLLRRLARQGKCVLMVTHDVDLISLAADSVCYMDGGKLLYHKAIAKEKTECLLPEQKCV